MKSSCLRIALLLSAASALPELRPRWARRRPSGGGPFGLPTPLRRRVESGEAITVGWWTAQKTSRGYSTSLRDPKDARDPKPASAIRGRAEEALGKIKGLFKQPSSQALCHGFARPPIEDLRCRLQGTSAFQRSLPGPGLAKRAVLLTQLAYGELWHSNPRLMYEYLGEFMKLAPRSKIIYWVEEPSSSGTCFFIMRSPTHRTVTVSFTGSLSPFRPNRAGKTTLNRQGIQNFLFTNFLTWKTPLEKRCGLRNWPFVSVGETGVGLCYGFKKTYDSQLGRHYIGMELNTQGKGKIYTDFAHTSGTYDDDNDVSVDLETKLTKLLDTHMKKGDKLIITGHSLGGALATVFGTKYALAHAERDVRVITFGAPRVGNYAFRDLVEKLPNLAVARVVNKEDIVARIPCNLYHHVGHTIEVGDSDPRVNAWNNPGPGWNGYTKLFKCPFKCFDDHAMGNYVDSTEKAVKSPDWLRSIDRLESEKTNGSGITTIGNVSDFRHIRQVKPRSPVPVVFLLGLAVGGYAVHAHPKLEFLDQKPAAAPKKK